MKPVSAARLEWVFAALIGLISFWIVVGFAPLDPTNIRWFQSPDPVQSYLGWAFYRGSPWTWPPTANPLYGLELSGSVLMSDSNPLFALLFKLLSPILPHPFQYFGIWLLICFVLQALFAYAISRKFFERSLNRSLSTILIVFSPPFLARFASTETSQLTLSGQWQILAAIFIYLSPAIPRRVVWWASLAAIGVLTNPYLLAMTAAFWFADILRTLRVGQTPPGSVFLSCAFVVGVVTAVALVSGVYAFPASGSDAIGSTLSTAVEGPPGLYKFNLDSPFDPEGWSYFLPRLPRWSPGEYEGYAYLGAGWLLLLACAVVMAVRRPAVVSVGRQHYPLAVCLLGLLVFAASPLISIGAVTFSIPWPSALFWLGHILRSTGRFAWPVYYAGVVFVLWVLSKWPNTRPVTAILAIATVLQVGDTSAGWGRFSAAVAKEDSEWPSPMTSPFWAQAARKYRAIRLAEPTGHYSPYVRDIGYFAQQHGLGTDAVYLGRVSAAGLAADEARAAKSRRVGEFPSDSIWILDGATYRMLSQRPACRGDFIGQVDGYLVLAPRYFPTQIGGC